jgi:hypothetical protein
MHHIKICDFIPQGKAGSACDEYFHNFLCATLFKAASGVFLPSFLFGIKTLSQTRATNFVLCWESRTTKFVLCRNVYAPNIIRCKIPRGDAVCLIAADVHFPQNVSVGHGAEAVLCPLYQKKLRKRTSSILISSGAGFRDPPVGGAAVSSPLHLKLYFTSLSILIVFNNFPVASFWGADAFNVLLFSKNF